MKGMKRTHVVERMGMKSRRKQVHCINMAVCYRMFPLLAHYLGWRYFYWWKPLNKSKNHVLEGGGVQALKYVGVKPLRTGSS